MSKKDILKAIADMTGLSQKDIDLVLSAFRDIVKFAVIAGSKVSIPGFLTFEKKHIPAKSGVTRLGGVEKPWSTPEKDEVSVKLSKSYKAIEE